MQDNFASEGALDVDGAVRYLREKHGIKYSVDRFARKARRGEVPSFMVGKYRRYRPSHLDAFALGEWTPPKSKRKAS
ncbi:MAG: hypothetical protein AB7T31_18280 [Gemmatimonadales bacterium]